MQEFAIQPSDIHAAADRIRDAVLETPCLHNERISKDLSNELPSITPCNVFFKCENLQRIGAFKARGATNAVRLLDQDQAARGVVTHSSGNHAAALARAASSAGIDAHIVMPRNAPEIKIAAVRRYGIEPVFCEPTTTARQAMADQVQQQTGATMIHPYNHPHVMAGQGTVGLEILDQCPGVTDIIVPVGGGGLLAGILTLVKSAVPQIRIFAAEPAWADDAHRSLQHDSIQSPTRYDTVADGLRTQLGDLTFPIIRDMVDGILLVEEDEIRSATRDLQTQAHLVAEPSGAVTFAAIRKHIHRFAHRTIVAIISGGNLDPNFDQ